MELRNDHVIPEHILLRRPGRDELEAAEQMRDEHVQLHIRKTVAFGQLLKSRAEMVLYAMAGPT